MKKKKIIKEKLGGGYQIGRGGVNSDGPTYKRYSFKHPNGYHSGGFQGDADSLISQRHALASTLDEETVEYEEDQNMLEEELIEFFARIMKMPLTEQEKKEIKELEEEDEDSEVKEMSAGGVAGVATPLGTNSKGKVPSEKEKKDRIDHAIKTFGGK